jgi:hypothetical protein
MAPWLHTLLLLGFLLLDFERLSPDNSGFLALERGGKKLKEMVKDPEEFVSFANLLTNKPLILSPPTSGKKIGFLHNCFEKEGSLLGIAGFAATSPLQSFSAYGTCAGLVSDSLAPTIGTTLVPSAKPFLDCKTRKTYWR